MESECQNVPWLGEVGSLAGIDTVPGLFEFVKACQGTSIDW